MNPKVYRSSIAKAIETLLTTGARQSVVYQHPKLSVKATRRHRPDARSGRVELLVTIGRPSYEGRTFIKNCLLAGEPFPVRSAQLKFFKPRTR